MIYDVVIVGGGPAGLAAALALGRARKRVLLCDAGEPRNARAVQMHNFVTRDGATPADFRRVAREQLAAYPNVECKAVQVAALTGTKGAFEVAFATGTSSVTAKRVLLCTGMIDEMLPIAGFRELWGRAVFQCPYCHGWEVQDRRWGYLVRPEHVSHLAMFALQLCGWTNDVTVFTNGVVDIGTEVQQLLSAGGVVVEAAPVQRLVAQGDTLIAVELENGRDVACETLFAHPPQQQVAFVRTLALALDSDGFVQVDPMSRQTSLPGIFAAGDLTSRMQAAIAAAASGMQAAAVINVELAMERAAVRAQ